MASPRQPRTTSGPRRTAADLVRAAAAAIVLVALIVGLPLLLLALTRIGLPIRMPDLTQPDYDGGMVVTLLWALAWLGWALFTVATAIELVAHIRGVRVRRISGLAAPQRVAGALVAAVMVVLTAAPLAASAATPAYASPPPAAVTVATAAAHETAPVTATTPTTAPTTDNQQLPRYVVQPRDCLWDIAETYLGDGHRYREIVALSRGITQPGGYSLNDADEVDIGWTVILPADAHGPGLKVPTARPAAHTADAANQPTHRSVTVAHGESLSIIADRELGDPARWRELFDLNRGRPQTHGGVLADPDLLRVGWTLLVPAGRPAPAVPAPAAPQATAPQQAPDQAQAQQPGAQPAAPDAPAPQQPAAPQLDSQAAPPTAQEPAAPTQQPSAPVEQQPAPTPQQHDAADEESLAEQAALPASLAIGGLLAASLVTILVRRRRSQQRRRRPGRRITLPPPPALTLERQLRATEDPLTVELLDAALRDLARRLADDEVSLPDLAGVLLSESDAQLILRSPAAPAPPFRADHDVADRWSLDLSYLPALRAGTARLDGIAAPYPALVALGHDGAGSTVLVDLEAAGALAVTGAEPHTDAALRSIALELASSAWADHLLVTVVGFGHELPDALGTGRCRFVPDLDTALDDLERHADQVGAVLADSRAGSVLAARGRGIAGDVWTPHIVIVPTAPTLAQLERIARIARIVDALPRTCVAAVHSGDGAAAVRADWVLPVEPEKAHDLPALGVPVCAQLVDEGTYEQVLSLFAATNGEDQPPVTAGWADAVVPLEPALEVTRVSRRAEDRRGPAAMPAAVMHLPVRPQEALPDGEDETPDDVTYLDAMYDDSSYPEAVYEPDAAGPADGASEGAIPVEAPAASVRTPAALRVTELNAGGPEVRILGPVAVIGAQGPMESGKLARATELAALLALNPGLSAEEVSEALWPVKAPTASTRNTLMSKLRAWLGSDPSGLPYVPAVPDGDGYRLSDAVRCDWTRFEALALRGMARGPGGMPELQQAMDLLRGQPFAGVHPRRYAWADAMRQEMFASIVDVAHSLGQWRTEAGDYDAARDAFRRGLEVDPIAEILYRGLFRTEFRAGNRRGIEAALDELEALCNDLETDPEPETVALANQLLAGHHAARSS